MDQKAIDIELQQVTELLGLKQRPSSPIEAHDLLVKGLPAHSLSYLVDHLLILPKTASLKEAVGMSSRTFQRRKYRPNRLLNREQSSRTWKFAKVLAKATEVLGTQEAAENWLDHPAMGLDNRRPLDLLRSPAGAELVESFLTKLEYGVYV